LSTFTGKTLVQSFTAQPRGTACELRSGPQPSSHRSKRYLSASTEEHLAIYVEDEESVFWSTPEKCFALLPDDLKRQAIARAEREHCIRTGYRNKPIVASILDTLLNKC